jgi:Cation efflux system protein CusB domain 1
MDTHFSLPLFRQEALEHAGQRSFLSQVIITTPIHYWVSTITLLGFTTVGLYFSTLVQLPRMMELSGQIVAQPNLAAEVSAQLWADANTTTKLRPGQEVQVKYAAFPFQTYGVFTGRVKTIADRSIEAAQQHPAQTFSYPVEVDLKQQHIPVGSQIMPLRPGMTLTANILLERKTLFDWLLEPLMEGKKNGGI